MRRPRPFLLLAAVTATLALGAPPALAHDGEHGTGGQQGPTISSKNVKLLANLSDGGTVRQSDLAFDGTLAYAGNYGGFRIIDVADPAAPRQVADVKCNGTQGDVGVYGGLAFQSVDQPQSSGACDSRALPASERPASLWEGVRIFDVRNPAAPVLLNSVYTPCGSHTHTVVPDPARDRVLLYVSSYPLGAGAITKDCRSGSRAEGGHDRISIIEVPMSDPRAATVTPYVLDAGTQPATYNVGGTWTFSACHDISVNTALQRAAAACLSEAQVWDISDPAKPVFLRRYDDPVVKTENIDLWHSATFSWDGKVVAFGDESGGGGAARCSNPDDRQGRIHFVDLATNRLLADYKVPRAEAGTCTMHNFNFLPLRDGRKVLVSSAYTAGTTFVDVDALIAGASPAAAEIGFYRAHATNTWSTYWYNGHAYGNDERGLDVYLLSDRARAGAVKLDMLNPQTQTQLIG